MNDITRTSKELLVFKATPKHYPDSPCHFGDYTTARAWAGDGGTIETVTLRPQPKLVQSDHEPPDVLTQIEELLQTMICSAEVFTDTDGTVTGYKIKTGALHKIVGLRTHLFFPQNMQEAERAAQPPVSAHSDCQSFIDHAVRKQQAQYRELFDAHTKALARIAELEKP